MSYPQTQRLDRPGLFFTLAFAVLAAALHTTVSLLVSAAEQGRLEEFLPNLAVTTLVLLATFATLGLLSRWLSPPGAGQTLRVFLPSGLAALVLLVFAPLLDSSLTSGNDRILIVTLVLLASIAAAGLGYFSTTHRFGYLESAHVWKTAALAAVSMSLPVLVLTWAFQTKINVFDDQSGRIRMLPLLLLMACLVLCLVSIPLSARLFSRRRELTVLLILALLFVTLPLAPVLSHRIEHARRRSELNHEATVEKVFLISVDTLRADALGAYEPDSRLTPRIDELSESSVVFLNARSSSPWTKPAFASLLTGFSPLVHGVLKPKSLLPELPTLASRLHEEGYYTTAIGRNSMLSEVFGFDKGFSEFDVYLGVNVTVNPSIGSRIRNGLGLSNSRPTTERLADLAIRWIEHHRDEPFFLWLHFFDPHAPYAPPPAFLPPAAEVERYGKSFGSNAAVRAGHRVLSAGEKVWIKNLYDGEVRNVDHHVGRVLDSIRDLGLFDDSLIIFTSDHGEEFLEHGGLDHGQSLFDELLRVPLLFKMPGTSEPKRLSPAVSTESLTPTVLDILSINADPRGSSSPPLTDLITGSGDQSWSQALVSTGLLRYEDRISVVYEGFKYIRPLGGGSAELYDLDLDPRELNPVMEDDSGRALEAQALLNEHAERCEDLREAFGIRAWLSRGLNREVLEDLRALGYLQ